MVQAGLQAIYLSGWQVAADANLAGADLPRPEPLPGEQRAGGRPAAQQRARCAPTRSTGPRATTATYWLAPIVADAEAGFGGAAERVRADEGDDRGGRRRRPLRGPARRRRRSAATWAARCSCRPASSSARCSAARLAADVLDVPTVLVARTDALAATLLTSDIDPRDAEFLTGERTPEGFFRRARRPRAGDRARARLRAVRRRALVRDVDARTSTRHASSPRRSTSSSPASCSPTTARRRSTGSGTSTTTRSRASSASSASWATASSSSRSPASTRSTRRCSSWRSGYARRGHDRLRRAAGARVRARGRRLHGDPPPARGRRRLLRPGRAGGHAAASRRRSR